MKNELKESGELEHPFYLTSEQLESLRLELQSISPEKQKIYQELQKKACAQFAQVYGAYLAEGQKEYLAAENIIIADAAKIPLLHNDWDKKIDQTSPKTLLNGKQYLTYKILEARMHRKTVTDTDTEVAGGDTAMHYWAGRLAVVPLLDGFEDTPVGPEFLESQEEYEDQQGRGWRVLANAGTFITTLNWTKEALHEKIHGIQRYDIPLPWLEISAYYYTDRTFHAAHWKETVNIGFDEAILYWDKLVRDIGPDLHRFILGNLPAQRDQEVRSALERRFTHNDMDRLFNPGRPYRQVKWFTGEDLPPT